MRARAVMVGAGRAARGGRVAVVAAVLVAGGLVRLVERAAHLMPASLHSKPQAIEQAAAAAAGATAGDAYSACSGGGGGSGMYAIMT